MDSTTTMAVRHRLCISYVAALLMALGGSALAQATGCTKLVATGNPEYAPYLWRDPQQPNLLVGANADLMQWLAKEVDTPIETRYVGSWAAYRSRLAEAVST